MQLVDYREHRWKFLQWLRTQGETPEKREGYSDYTTYETGYLDVDNMLLRIPREGSSKNERLCDAAGIDAAGR
jgi:hypothetical protein